MSDEEKKAVFIFGDPVVGEDLITPKKKEKEEVITQEDLIAPKKKEEEEEVFTQEELKISE